MTGIGLTVTTDLGNGNLGTLLPSQEWDVVIIQIDNFSLQQAEIDAITTYISNGGKIIFNYWDMNAAPTSFTELMGIANTISFTTPMEVEVWDTANSIFSNPNAISNIPTNGTDNGNDNGDRLEPTADASVIAGFVATPTTNEGAIILANDNFSIYHGFSLQDMDATVAAELIENEIEFLLVTLSTEESELQDNVTIYPVSYTHLTLPTKA